MTLVFDVEGVYRHPAIARYLIGTRSILEAKETLDNLGIYTGLDLEYNLLELRKKGKTTVLEVLNACPLGEKLRCQA